jgi:hypothetical protein
MGLADLVVWLASFPRSGNTFFRIVLDEIYGLQSQSLYTEEPAGVSRRMPDPVRAGLKDLRASKQVHFIKTHGLPEDDDPAVLLVRDGRDAMVSYAHFIGDYNLGPPQGLEGLIYRVDDLRQRWMGRRPFEVVLRRLIQGKYANWSAHYHAWRRRPAGCAVVKFESLVKEPAETIGRSLSTLGIQLPSCPSGAPPDFRTLHAQDPKFFRSGATGQWKAEMSPKLEDLFWRRHHEAMLDAGYQR